MSTSRNEGKMLVLLLLLLRGDNPVFFLYWTCQLHLGTERARRARGNIRHLGYAGHARHSLSTTFYDNIRLSILFKGFNLTELLYDYNTC